MSDWINDRTPRQRATPVESWSVVVPVKGGPDAKSRLRAPDGVDRLVLARALALDTVTAASEAVGASRVLVVTSDPEVLTAIDDLGVATLADPGDGLNAAVRAGLAALPANRPAVVLLGDVPALRAVDLRAALVAADHHDGWFVADAEGTGTVLLGSAQAGSLRPAFGSGSAARHEHEGYHRLDLDLDRLRRDVDDEVSLGEALRLGVGPSTAGLLAHLIRL
jgi:2-phospho-L-lactate guanylyltransferase